MRYPGRSSLRRLPFVERLGSLGAFTQTTFGVDHFRSQWRRQGDRVREASRTTSRYPHTRLPHHPRAAAGVSYHFVSEQRFREMVASGDLLEHAVVHGTHSYGTPRRDVVDAIASGRDVLLEIDIQGARQVKRNLPDAKLVFIAPPSWEELVRRLRGRGTESASQVGHRLATARTELQAQGEADFVIVNDRIEDTVQALIVLMGL